jgi:hypothetical protein
MITNMQNLKKLQLLALLLLFATFAGYGQPISRISIDFRGGMPSILTKAANPIGAPFGGTGVRYSFNKYFSLSLDVNGGVISGRTQNGFFRNNFIQYGGKAHFNTTAFINGRSDIWKRFNVYLSFGMNNMHYYYTLNQTSVNNKLNRLYFLYDAGITARYYCNEMVDFIAGSNFNFSQTTAIDNYHQSKYDHFALTYIGLSLKILPYERKQLADWSHIDLPYSTGTMALTKQLVGNLEKGIREQNQKDKDSITAVLRNEIKTVDTKVITVDTKVDSVDSKLNLVLELLNKMNTQGVNVNQQLAPSEGSGTGTAPAGKGNKTKASSTDPKKGAGTTGQKLETTPVPQKDAEEVLEGIKKINPTVVTTPPPSSATPKQSGNNSGTRAAILDQSKVKENYAIVVGSFQVDENAVRARERYIERGWDAHILGMAKSPYKRIVIFSNNYYEAAKIVTELRVTDQPDVWMLDINTGKGVYIK